MTLMTVATTGLCSTHSVGKQTYAAPGTPHLSYFTTTTSAGPVPGLLTSVMEALLTEHTSGSPRRVLWLQPVVLFV